MSIFLNKKTQDILPYVAGEQPPKGMKVIKLNTNENPYPPSPKAIEAVKKFDYSSLKLYPDTMSSSVREAVAKVDHVRPTNVYVGNGSDEVLAICWQALFEKEANTDKAVYVPEISYSFYPVYSSLYDTRIKKIPLREDYSIDPMLFRGDDMCGVVIANPNAPTSIAMSIQDIRTILDNCKDVPVVIDEAYVAFLTKYESSVSLLDEYENLVVVRTMSKAYSLAGARVGYAIASESIIEGLNKIKDSFNSYPLDRIAQTMAAESLLDEEYYDSTRNEIINTRDNAREKLMEMGFSIPESSANFLFAKPPQEITAKELYQSLKEMGILVRYFDKPKINDRLRISIGTQEEMEKLIEAIAEVIHGT